MFPGTNHAKFEIGFSKGFKRIVLREWILTVATIIMVFGMGVPGLTEEFGIQRRSDETRKPVSPPAVYLGSPERSLYTEPSRSSIQSAPQIASSLSVRQDGVPATPTAPFPNVVRLIAFDNNGRSFGSGSYIGNYGEYGLILSNWHVVCDADGLVHVHFPNGFSTYGAIVFSDKKWDLATIAISKPPRSVMPLPVAKSVPKPGDPLWIAGHGSGSYRLASGRCVRYLAPEIPKDGSKALYEIVELSVSARQGDSGGPILNRNGELAGVLFGSDMVQNTAGSYCERVSRFLDQSRPYVINLPVRPETYFATIEQNGPRRELRESLYSVPASGIASVGSNTIVDVAGSSSTFGIRSPIRRNNTAFPASVNIVERKQESPPVLTIPNEIQGPQMIRDSSSNTIPPISQKRTGSVFTAVWNRPVPVDHALFHDPTMLPGKHRLSDDVMQTGFDLDVPEHRLRENSPYHSSGDETTGGAETTLIRKTASGNTYTLAPLKLVQHNPAAVQCRYRSSETVHSDSFPPILRLAFLLFVCFLVFQAFSLLHGDREREPESDESSESIIVTERISPSVKRRRSA